MVSRIDPPPTVAAIRPSPLRADARTLRWLLVGGCLGIVAVWANEAREGHLADWDRLLYPVCLVWLLATLAVLLWWPRWEPAARQSSVFCLNLTVLVELAMILGGGTGPIDPYQLPATLQWAPLGLACAFVFLPLRQALLTAGLVYASELTLFLQHLGAGAPERTGADLARTLAINAAIVQPLYVLMLTGVSLMRSSMQMSDERARRMKEAAETDPLTGLANRRAIDESLSALLESVRLDGWPASVFMIDVDHFKAINDHRGHAVGDTVLVELARLLASQLRAGDQVGRWGGEEFLVMAHPTAPSAALELAERLRAAVQAHAFTQGQQVTVSIGVAHCRAQDTPSALLQRVDEALYAAKSGGRNRVCSAPES